MMNVLTSALLFYLWVRMSATLFRYINVVYFLQAYSTLYHLNLQYFNSTLRASYTGNIRIKCRSARRSWKQGR